MKVTVYVFLIQRPKIDRDCWPVVFLNRSLAEKCPDRVSPITEVELEKEKAP